MAVLYRKYRPQRFGEVLSQKYIIQTLKNQAQSGAFAHAYLFTGSRGVGKTSVARILAKAANCMDLMAGEPCGKCGNCSAIAAGNFIDLVEIDAASNTGVDNIRDVIEHVKFSPSQGKYKVFIIDEVHMLSKGAFNALLKTLEEPPKHAIFILATTEIHKVPATVVSRTQRFDFGRLGHEDLVNHLKNIVEHEKAGVPEAVLELVARNAEGGGRDALSLLDKVLTLGDKITLEDAQSLLGVTDITLSEDLLSAIAEGRAEQIPAFFESFMEKGLDFSLFNKDFLEYLRVVLVFQVTGGKVMPDLEAAHAEKIKTISGNLPLQDTVFTMRLFLKSFKEIGSSPSPDVPLLLAGIEAAIKRKGAVGQAPAPVAIAPAVQKPSQGPVADTLPSAQPAESRIFESIASYSVKPEPKPEPKPGASSDALDSSLSDFSLDEVRIFWPSVVDQVLKVNGPLAHLLKNSPVKETVGGEIIVGVKYQFHKQNLELKKNQEIIRAAIEKSSGKKAKVTAVIVKDEVQEVPTGEALADALKILGGELVE